MSVKSEGHFNTGSIVSYHVSTTANNTLERIKRGENKNCRIDFLSLQIEFESLLLVEHVTFIRTGDMRRFDEENFLYILNRKEGMIYSGGMNIFATDLGAVLIEHPDVSDGEAFAIPHEKWEAIKPRANSRLAKFQRIFQEMFQGQF